MNTTVSTPSTLGLQNGDAPTTTATKVVVTDKAVTSNVATPSGIVMSKNVVFKTISSTTPKSDTVKHLNRIEVKQRDIQSTVQIRTEDNKKIIISGAKSIKDIPVNVLQQILNNVKSVKPNETVLVISNANKSTVQNNQVKSYESIVKDVLQNDVTQKNGNGSIIASDVNKTDNIKNGVNKQTPNEPLKDESTVTQRNVRTNETEMKNLEDIAYNNAEKLDKNNKCTDVKNKEIVTNNLKNDVFNGEESIIKKSDRKDIPNDDTKENTSKNIDKDENKVNTSKLEKNDKDKLSLNLLPTKSIFSSSLKEIPGNTPKQKKFLYRLKSKNGKMLRYVSDTPIVLKKPVIRLDKMTQADAEKLSKQFAAEKKRTTRSTAKLLHFNDDLNETDINSIPQKSYGVRTRKRQLKFLPNGRQVKGKKSKRYSSSSSLSTLDDDDLDNPIVTSDEDYHEDVDIPMISSDDENKDTPIKSTNSKKVTSPKKVVPNKNLSFDNNDIKNNSKKILEKSSNSKNVTPSVGLQPKVILNANLAQKKLITTPPAKGIQNTNSAPTKVGLEPAAVFSTLLKIPISSYQLNVRRFKPQISSPANSNNPFMFKKIYSPDFNQVIPSTKQNVGGNTIFSSSGVQLNQPSKTIPENANKSANPATLTNCHISLARHMVDPPPLTPISRKETPASKNVNKSTFKTTVVPNYTAKPSVQDITAKFEGFTNTKIVKTKEGPKKAKLEEMKSNDDPRTIYDIMEEIFDSLPHWNIHVIQENKSFCLAHISLGRTGIPVLKKSIEINSEFRAKVYIHQLHCKRYDGIYDTESKIRKLIHEVDSVAV